MGNIVYESPDGGHTVYAREIGKTERVLVQESQSVKNARQMLEENRLWKQIFDAAKTNPLLQDTLDRAKLIYYMSKNDGKE